MKQMTLIVAVLTLVTCGVVAAPRDSGEAMHVDRQGRAAQGMDVVAYRSLDVDAPPVPGREEFSCEWRGATWLFSTQENLEVFNKILTHFRQKQDNILDHLVNMDREIKEKEKHLKKL